MKPPKPGAAASAPRPHLAQIFRGSRITICALLIAVLQSAVFARAEDATALATQISDGAFAMLNQLHGPGGSTANATLGAVAIFAGDAQALSRTLAAGDREGMPSALTTLESDRDAVDNALATNPGLADAAVWKRIKAELAALSKQLGTAGSMPRVSGGGAPSPPAAHASTRSSAPMPAETMPASTMPAALAPASAATSAGTIASTTGAGPRVNIESRTPEGASVRVKGFIEGNSLKRGGIFAGDRELRAFKVGSALGEERINFDIGIESPAPDEVIRVYDADGRMAEAPIADAALAVGSTGSDRAVSAGSGRSETTNAPEIPALRGPTAPASTTMPSTEGGVEVFRNNRDGDSGLAGVNTAEIPSHGAPRKSPSKRHTIGSHLGNVQVTITAANLIDPMTRTYRLAGQIQGRGITRAGIYVNRRLVKPITGSFDANVTSFDEKFVMKDLAGEVTIRAYGVGDQFVESAVDLSTAVASAEIPDSNPMIAGGSMMSGPTIENTSGIMVEITGVGPITRNVYVVTGVISGRSLLAAGLYQNGMLVQRIAVRGGGIGGVIGSLIPGAPHNVSFNVRFNPQAGPATVRAFDSSGGYNEQPVIVAGASPYVPSPYGMNPYGGSPYGYNPYGASPYGYNANPYGYGSAARNPYAGGTLGAPPVNPYIAPTNPFGSPPASSW